MAGDWIKMRTDLYRDPKVCRIADHLFDSNSELARHINQIFQREMTVTRNALRNVTVGALVTLWGVMRHRGKRVVDNLFVPGASLEVIDDIADVPGFGAAMKAVGWVTANKEGIVFPNFFEDYNVEPDVDHKGKNAERQRRFRQKHNALRNVTVTQPHNVTVTSHSNDRVEKSLSTNTTIEKGNSASRPVHNSTPGWNNSTPPPATAAHSTERARREIEAIQAAKDSAIPPPEDIKTLLKRHPKAEQDAEPHDLTK